MMNPEIKEQWCQALESGAFEQSKEYLCKISNSGTEEYCCLGVLCEINGLKKRLHGTMRHNVYRYAFDSSHSTANLPYKFREKMYITELEMDKLITMNDTGTSFVDIAKYIRENL